MPTDEHTKDVVEERAAIMEHDGGLECSDAQNLAASRWGFKDWADYLNQLEKDK